MNTSKVFKLFLKGYLTRFIKVKLIYRQILVILTFSFNVGAEVLPSKSIEDVLSYFNENDYRFAGGILAGSITVSNVSKDRKGFYYDTKLATVNVNSLRSICYNSRFIKTEEFQVTSIEQFVVSDDRRYAQFNFVPMDGVERECSFLLFPSLMKADSREYQFPFNQMVNVKDPIEFKAKSSRGGENKELSSLPFKAKQLVGEVKTKIGSLKLFEQVNIDTRKIFYTIFLDGVEQFTIDGYFSKSSKNPLKYYGVTNYPVIDNLIDFNGDNKVDYVIDMRFDAAGRYYLFFISQPDGSYKKIAFQIASC